VLELELLRKFRRLPLDGLGADATRKA